VAAATSVSARPRAAKSRGVSSVREVMDPTVYVRRTR
jgi:hypothetical protein